MIRAAFWAAALPWFPVEATASDCRLALALALDVSRSVDAREHALQRGGLVAALNAPEVRRAFFAAPLPVALAVYEWSGPADQHLLMDWLLIRAPDDLDRVADRLASAPRAGTDAPTAMGHALLYGAALMARGPDCLFRTIDISGDGENNEGPGPSQVYATAEFAGITVNGLPINGAEYETEIQLIPWFLDHVRHGPGAFIEVAQGFADFERAMRAKLERELSGMVIGIALP
ncbi:DUF1194 domain-containing protein [Ruegeria marina]|uniref:VWFA domain-containing protein n=1 Tax=Ruegeria marina TaxID=639004 RepID=A0A1G6SCK0_9RHOB|nr:DUF1194 domain-containing protein [Ruegeria marina]SDD13867.1 Protein of unknown function [Ruegeria marina]